MSALGSRPYLIFVALIVLLFSLFLSMLSTNKLRDVYKALHDPHDVSDTGSHHSSSRKDKEQDKGKKVEDMNIVLFYADDWAWRTVGAVNKLVKTPNLDAMAKRGILFRHNCVTTSICWQSRATKVTGLYVSVHQHFRVWGDTMFDKIVQWRDTLYPQLFLAGYMSGFVGKWHAPMNETFLDYTWHFFRKRSHSHWVKGGKNANGKTHITEVNRDDAFEFLNQLEKHNEENRVGMPKQKFALTVSFFATHAQDGKPFPDQYSPQNYSEPLYRDVTIPVPKTATEEAWQNMPWFFDKRNEGRRRWSTRFDTPEHYQVSMKQIYRMASEVDDVVGAIMDEVKKIGYSHDNTMFIFTTDNGLFHGEHGLADKWYPHEESIRVPLIIQDPRMPDHLRGTINDEFTLNIDLAPTILSAAGLPIPEYMQGRDIAQLYLGEYQEAARNWRKDFFYEWSTDQTENPRGLGDEFSIPAVFALVRKDYKYFYWPQAKYEQLFHVESDPFEESDIINTTLQTNPVVLKEIKARYAFLKNLSQRGYPV